MVDAPFDAEPQDEEFAEKRRTRLIIQRAAAPKPNDSSLSYFGGLPRLPPHLNWPLVPRRGEDGPGDGPVAPTFLAQLDLANLPLWRGRELFPLVGTIYIFCNTQYVDVGDPHCAVLYHNGSSSDFPERMPPENLMRIDGIWDRFRRSWCEEGDPVAGVGFKYEMKFELAPNAEQPALRVPAQLDWLPTYGYYGHPFLVASWPQTPLFVNTLRKAIIATVERTRTDYRGDDWPDYADLAALAQSFPLCAGEPFEWLSEEQRAPFREAFKPFMERFKERIKGASRVWSSTPFGLLAETALFCVSEGFAKGFFDDTTDDGRLHLVQEQIAQCWKEWNWPHQLLGAGIAVHDSVWDHIDDALLLQIAGADAGLAGSAPDCVLQIWVPKADLKRGIFSGAVATLECS